MTKVETILALWQDIAAQDAAMSVHFTEDAAILWPNTDESFSVPEFVLANQEYPGQWKAMVEQVDPSGRFSIARVWSPKAGSFRAVSFFHWRENKIYRLVEYWGDIETAPPWRQALGLGRPIRPEDFL